MRKAPHPSLSHWIRFRVYTGGAQGNATEEEGSPTVLSLPPLWPLFSSVSISQFQDKLAFVTEV